MDVARFALGVLSMLPWLGCAAAEDSPDALAQLSGFPESAITIAHAGKHDRFRVWTADTEARQERGLMFVRSMPSDRGMLFPRAVPDFVVLWMKNTYLSLDVLFIDESGVIVGIVANTTPLRTNTIPSPGPVTAVLELNAGETARRGIRTGDRVTVERSDAASLESPAATPLSSGRCSRQTKETMECSSKP